MLRRLLKRRVRYITLLACLLYTLMVDPFVPWEIGKELLAVLLVAAAFSVSDRRWVLIASAVLVTPAIVAVWWTPPGFEEAGRLFQAIFVFFVTILIHYEMLSSKNVTLDTVIGTVAGFLLFALAGSWVFMALEQMQPGSFAGLDDIEDLVYFSFVTISTLGYGDIVPLTKQARMYASLEAIFGQFYFALLVGRLLALYMEAEIRSGRREPNDTAQE